jgi:hypothetical protein
MSFFNRLKDELNRAGKAASDAIDEGKLRLEQHRSRQALDKAAQKLGYAVYRARKAGGDVPTEEYARIAAEVSNAEAEVERYETLLREANDRRKTTDAPPASDTPPASPPE